MAAVGIGQRPRRRVAVVVHVEGRGVYRHHPGRAAVGRAIGGARPPAHDGHRRQIAPRHQAEAPVVGVVVLRRGHDARAHGGDGEEITAAAGVEVGAGVGRHLVLVNAARRHGEAATARLRLVLDGDKRPVRVVEENVGFLGIAGVSVHRGAAHGIVVAVIPLSCGIEHVPARLVVRADVAGDQVHLYRPRGRHRGPAADAAVHLSTLPLVQRLCDVHSAVAVAVYLHHGTVLGGHDQQPHVLKHLVSVDIHAHGRFEVGAVLAGVLDFHGSGQHRPWCDGPPSTSHGDALVDAELIPAVVADLRGVARQGDVVLQGDDVVGVDHVAGETGRDAVRRVVVTPHLRRALRGMLDVQLVAVLPVIVVDQCVVGGSSDGDHAAQDGARAAVQGQQRVANLRLGARHEVGLEQHCRLSRLGIGDGHPHASHQGQHQAQRQRDHETASCTGGTTPKGKWTSRFGLHCLEPPFLLESGCAKDRRMN